MQRVLDQEVSQFSSMMAAAERPHQGQISLEFYQKKKAKWPFATECMPWEVWTLRMETVDLANERGQSVQRSTLSNCVVFKNGHANAVIMVLCLRLLGDAPDGREHKQLCFYRVVHMFARLHLFLLASFSGRQTPGSANMTVHYQRGNAIYPMFSLQVFEVCGLSLKVRDESISGFAYPPRHCC